MRALTLCLAGLLAARSSSAGPTRAKQVEPSACGPVADRVADTLTTPAARRAIHDLVARRCDRDRWSAEVNACLVAARTGVDGQHCLDRLSKDQLRALEGDADRLSDPGADVRTAFARFEQWVLRRPLAVRVAAQAFTVMTVALDAPDSTDPGRARTLHDQGVAAYQVGKLDLAIKKLGLALDANPTPELMYHVAQAYRIRGERGDWRDLSRALDLYEQYLDAAPTGAASADCRAQVEKLRDRLP